MYGNSISRASKDKLDGMVTVSMYMTLFQYDIYSICMMQIGKGWKRRKGASKGDGVTHVLIASTISAGGQRQANNKQNKKNTHKLRQAAQLWGLKVVEFPVEAGSFPSCRFLLLTKGIFVQRTAIRMELETAKGAGKVMG
jgi:hypothetical protein